MPHTYFKDENGESLGSADGVLPISLVKGMTITIEGHQGEFRVIDWNYHHGHDADEDGLRIILRSRQAQQQAAPQMEHRSPVPPIDQRKFK